MNEKQQQLHDRFFIGELEEHLGSKISVISMMQGNKNHIRILQCETNGKMIVLRISDRDDEDENPERLRREEESAKYLMSVKHDHIVEVLDFVTTVKYVYTIMPYYIYKDLAIVMNSQTLSLAVVVQIIYQLSKALRFLHHGERRVVHRDIDLENIFVEQFDGGNDLIKIRLADFEYCRFVTGTEETTFMGRPYNYPPLNENGLYKCGPDADIWCLGVIMYRLLTNDRKTDLSKFEDQSKLDKFISEKLERNRLKSFCLSCLKIDRKERITAVTLTELLLRFICFKMKQINNTEVLFKSLFLMVVKETFEEGKNFLLEQQHHLLQDELYLIEVFNLLDPNNSMECLDNFRIPDNSILTYFLRGNRYLDMKDYLKAIEDYSKAIELDSSCIEAYFNRGNTYNDMKEYLKAIEDYSKVIELDSSFFKTYNNRGNTYNNMKEYLKAIEDYSKAIELDSSCIDAYLNRGNTYNDMKEYLKSIEDYSKVIELDSSYVNAYFNRTVSHWNSTQYSKASRDLYQVFELDPDMYFGRCLKIFGLEKLIMCHKEGANTGCMLSSKLGLILCASNIRNQTSLINDDLIQFFYDRSDKDQMVEETMTYIKEQINESPQSTYGNLQY